MTEDTTAFDNKNHYILQQIKSFPSQFMMINIETTYPSVIAISKYVLFAGNFSKCKRLAIKTCEITNIMFL